jgi:hypothetical protein
MRIAVPEKVLKIIASIDAQGNVPLMRLTVLKKWFEGPGRLAAFGLWIAQRAAQAKGGARGAADALLEEARALLGSAASMESLDQQMDRAAAKSLRDRARDFQNDLQHQQWGPVRMIHCWPLLLVEEGLALHLGPSRTPSAGYKLAADWAQNYDSRYGNGLNGPSRAKLDELVRFMLDLEAREENRAGKDFG